MFYKKPFHYHVNILQNFVLQTAVMIYFIVTQENASIIPLFVMDTMTVETLAMNRTVVNRIFMLFSLKKKDIYGSIDNKRVGYSIATVLELSKSNPFLSCCSPSDIERLLSGHL